MEMQQLILARCSPRVYCLTQLSQPKLTGITNQSFKTVDYYNLQGKATTMSWRGSIHEVANSVLYNSTGPIFSGPEIKHKYTSFFRLSWTCLKNKATSLKLFKVKQRARPANSTAHPRRASQAVQAAKLASWQSCTILAIQPENKEEKKLSPPH